MLMLMLMRRSSCSQLGTSTLARTSDENPRLRTTEFTTRVRIRVFNVKTERGDPWGRALHSRTQSEELDYWPSWFSLVGIGC